MTYHPKLVTATVGLAAGGVIIPGLPQGLSLPYTVVGKSADSFFTTANDTPMITVAKGAEGNNDFVISADEAGVMNITVKKDGAANRIFSIIFRAQRLIGSGQLPPFSFPVSYRNNNKSPPESHEGVQCMIGQQPDADYGADQGDVLWAFVTLKLISNYT